MYAFLAVIMIMLLVKVSRLRDYWDASKSTYNKNIDSIMSMRRFEAILHNLHFADE